MKKFGIDANHVVSHYDVCAKNCPSAIRAKGDWNRFKQLIGAKTAATTVDKYYRTGMNTIYVPYPALFRECEVKK